MQYTLHTAGTESNACMILPASSGGIFSKHAKQEVTKFYLEGQGD